MAISFFVTLSNKSLIKKKKDKKLKDAQNHTSTGLGTQAFNTELKSLGLFPAHLIKAGWAIAQVECWEQVPLHPWVSGRVRTGAAVGLVFLARNPVKTRFPPDCLHAVRMDRG